MSRRAFNLSEFVNGLLQDMANVQALVNQTQYLLHNMEVKLQVAAKMAEPKSKKEGKTNGDGNNE